MNEGQFLARLKVLNDYEELTKAIVEVRESYRELRELEARLEKMKAERVEERPE